MEEETRLSHEEFVIRAMKTLRKGSYKGLHVVYSGFNDAFRQYFPGDNPVEAIDRLVAAGKIVKLPTRRGVRIYLPDDAPPTVGTSALDRMGLS